MKIITTKFKSQVNKQYTTILTNKQPSEKCFEILNAAINHSKNQTKSYQNVKLIKPLYILS